MIYKRRNLRRLWKVKVYDGDREAKKPKTKTERVIAWNALDVIRKCGNVAEQPVPLDYVTFDEPPLIIRDTAGPTDETAKTTM